jgi:hypothetical protein
VASVVAETFNESAFWKAARAAFAQPVPEIMAPRSLLERFAGAAHERLRRCCGFSHRSPHRKATSRIDVDDGAPTTIVDLEHGTWELTSTT